MKDLGIDMHAEANANGSARSGSDDSPVKTTTPLSMSESESSSPPPAGSGNESGGLGLSSMMGLKRPGGFSDGPNARSKSVTVADGDDTFGVLNRHPAEASSRKSPKSGPSASPSREAASAASGQHAGAGDGGSSLKGSFRVGVSEDKNKKCRRTMEDAHSFVYDFAGIRGQGYFAVFDGHAGKHAAEWCGQHFHKYLLDAVLSSPDQAIPDLLNKTFHVVDARLSHLAQSGKTQSGCTAVTAFLRVEHAQPPAQEGQPRGFTNPGLKPRGLADGRGEEEVDSEIRPEETPVEAAAAAGGSSSGSGSYNADVRRRSSGTGRRLREFMGRLTGTDKKNDSASGAAGEDEQDEKEVAQSGVEAIEPRSEHGLRRVLYTANVGDARAVLCRGGKGVRLTYDHKGSDSQEAKRITDAGGFVMNNRVNGVLAVTRSLGDASMKEFVVGSPYTTETTLDEQDEFLIVACDGLWDVCDDQQAVDLVRSIMDPQEASKKLLDHAMTNYSTDNLSVMVVRFY